MKLNDIIIRTQLQPGDIGYVVHRHGALYKQEYNYGIEFETYVAVGLHEFFWQYDPSLDRVWLCEHNGMIIGSLFLVHRPEKTSQLRYFLIEPGYRSLGLGKKLMILYMDRHHQCGYTSAYLWTTKELEAAAALYRKFGFILTEEKKSSAFGKDVIEQRYDLH